MKAGHTLCNTLGPTLKSLSVFFQDLKKVSESKDINISSLDSDHHTVIQKHYNNLCLMHNQVTLELLMGDVIFVFHFPYL